MVFHARGANFAVNALFHIRQRYQRGIIEITAINKGAQGIQQELPARLVARHRPRLHQGITLPVATMEQIILLHRIMGERQRPGLAKRTQAHIHAITKAFFRDFIQGANQLLRQLAEKDLVRFAFRTIGFAAVGINKNQINIGGKIELASAKLAHAQHGHRHDIARFVARIAITRCQTFKMPVQGGIDHTRRQIR